MRSPRGLRPGLKAQPPLRGSTNADSHDRFSVPEGSKSNEIAMVPTTIQRRLWRAARFSTCQEPAGANIQWAKMKAQISEATTATGIPQSRARANKTAMKASGNTVLSCVPANSCAAPKEARAVSKIPTATRKDCGSLCIAVLDGGI